jgi:2-methylcitrate dehydratase PrpD
MTAAARMLARHVCRTSYAELPASAVEAARRDIPHTFGMAQFAQPFLVATALAHGKVGIAEVNGLGDPAILALSDRIAGIARRERRKGSFSITVQRTEGRSVTIEAGNPTGSPEKPLTDAQFRAKFRDCTRDGSMRD